VYRSEGRVAECHIYSPVCLSTLQFSYLSLGARCDVPWLELVTCCCDTLSCLLSLSMSPLRLVGVPAACLQCPSAGSPSSVSILFSLLDARNRARATRDYLPRIPTVVSVKKNTRRAFEGHWGQHSHSRRGGADFAEVNVTLTGWGPPTTVERTMELLSPGSVNVVLTSAKSTRPCRVSLSQTE